MAGIYKGFSNLTRAVQDSSALSFEPQLLRIMVKQSQQSNINQERSAFRGTLLSWAMKDLLGALIHSIDSRRNMLTCWCAGRDRLSPRHLRRLRGYGLLARPKCAANDDCDSDVEVKSEDADSGDLPPGSSACFVFPSRNIAPSIPTLPAATAPSTVIPPAVTTTAVAPIVVTASPPVVSYPISAVIPWVPFPGPPTVLRLSLRLLLPTPSSLDLMKNASTPSPKVSALVFFWWLSTWARTWGPRTSDFPLLCPLPPVFQVPADMPRITRRGRSSATRRADRTIGAIGFLTTLIEGGDVGVYWTGYVDRYEINTPPPATPPGVSRAVFVTLYRDLVINQAYDVAIRRRRNAIAPKALTKQRIQNKIERLRATLRRILSVELNLERYVNRPVTVCEGSIYEVLYGPRISRLRPTKRRRLFDVYWTEKRTLSVTV
ncbi:hypothetical protein DFP72DRAFT_1085199 [Ephemerocybe angulata]|uniref:Uncharacterized protein n=2 Tax=Ephemerocybe angulata TaxID=980116 RepID=A0A8H6LTZ1_9AGAR|nr:hypothetical protein DFP72DRAFT_1085199 [Tulosesus angulatus]